jgi:Fe-Mn family superoxide dismutase
MDRRNTLKLMLGAAGFVGAQGLLGRGAAWAQAASGPFSLPPLGYPYEALEPHIDAMTMNIHHTRHHQAYVTAANGLVAKWPELGTKPINEVLKDTAAVPVDVRPAVKNNVGGHWNHTMFWELMTPGGAKEPAGELKSAIDGAFSDLAKLKERVNAAGTQRFGSGWAWLVVGKDGKLDVLSTANQDTPLELGVKNVVLGVDVWEHAYYLKYQNKRADYLAAWWNTVNWDKAAANFKKAV